MFGAGKKLSTMKKGPDQALRQNIAGNRGRSLLAAAMAAPGAPVT